MIARNDKEKKMPKIGKVYLVGAGPGDPDLISVKGANCLRQADVVVYDRLANEAFLALAPPTAEMIDVGKAAGNHTMPQPEINKLLAAKAKEGKTVVRLKGGDPFVFGRGGEEAEVLVAEGVPFEVVPGITSAIAVPAYAGIPVSHRGLASSFAVITGHEDPAKPDSSINWEKLATGVDTLVFLMGLGNLAEIASKLVENGRSASTPVAVISQGTYPGQQVVTGTLKNIIECVEKHPLPMPAITVVGKVVGMREKIAWFDNRPLFGKRVLVTRATGQASNLGKLLTEHGAIPVEMPAIEIQPIEKNAELEKAISNLEDYNWLIFTSANAVAAFWHGLEKQKKDARALSGLTVGAIGPATKQTLEAKGISPDFVPEIHTSEGIADALKKEKIIGARFLLPRADIADKALAEAIAGLGATVDDIAVYQTAPATAGIARAKKALDDSKIDIITFASSSKVNNLVAAFKGKPVELHGAKVACIGPKTAETVRKAGLKVDIMAKEQSIPALVEAIEEYYSKKSKVQNPKFKSSSNALMPGV